MGIYEFAVLGSVTPEQRQSLIDSIGQMVSEFDLNVGKEVRIYDAVSANQRNRSSAFAAVYFGGEPQVDIEDA
ncbi:TPA: toll/interleukin-1 receptor domain-containing protein, partial [Vibrio vulnificus]